MSVRKRMWFWVAIAIVAVGLAIVVDPAARVQGWVRGEPFYRHRSATSWRHELRDSDEVEAADATIALASGREGSLPVCTWLLRHAPEPQVRSRALNALEQMGKAAAPAGGDLLAALADGDPLVRSAAARVIGGLAPDVPGAVPALIDMFPDREAVRAVAAYKSAAAPAVPKLIELTKHTDASIRRQAVRSLGRIGSQSMPALPNLIALVTDDPEPGVREFAAAVLGEFGLAAEQGIPSLIKALKDPEARVRLEAVRSLGMMGPAVKVALADIEALAAADPEEPVREAAKTAARKLEPGKE